MREADYILSLDFDHFFLSLHFSTIVMPEAYNLYNWQSENWNEKLPSDKIYSSMYSLKPKYIIPQSSVKRKKYYNLWETENFCS